MGAKLREYTPADLESLKRLHKKVWPTAIMPKFDANYKMHCQHCGGEVEVPLYPVKKVLTLDDEVVAAGLGCVELEAHFLLDHGDWGDPVQKFMALRVVQAAALQEAKEMGIESCYATIHEKLEHSYAKRLSQLGWTKSLPGWSMWFRNTEK